MRIQVQPERLRETARLLRQAADAWQAQAAHLQRAMDSLAWEVRQQAQVEAQGSQAARLAHSLAEGARQQAAALETAAARFEAADREGTQRLGEVLGAAVGPFSLPAWLSLPGHPIWNLARLFGAGELPLTRLLPSAVTAAGVTALTSPAWSGQRLERVWNWLNGRGWKTDAELLPPPADSVPKGQLYETIRRGFERLEKEQEQGASPGRVVQTLEVDEPHAATPQGQQPEIRLHPVDPRQYTSCVRYAQDRRPDLGLAPGDGGAYNYIEKFHDRLYHLPPEAADLRRTSLRVGTAVVWDRGQQGAHPQYGHVAIIEEVREDEVIVSEAGWGDGAPRRAIPRERLTELHFIL